MAGSRDSVTSNGSSSSSTARSWGLGSIFKGLSEYKKRLNLPNPGTFEGLHREVKTTFLTNHLFDGARADLTKVLSQNFQVMHQFTLGSSAGQQSYNFGTAYVGTKTVLHGTVDTDGNLSARANYMWTPNFVTKIQAQLSPTPGHSMLQLEQDYQGSDYSINFKTVNPSPVDSTGIFILSYLQSVTQKLSLGTEIVYQKLTSDLEETVKQYVMKYTGKDYIATLNYQEAGALQASYYQKINEKVDFGTELQMLLDGGRRAVCTVGGKFDFRAATIRGQVDTTGRVSVVIEEKIAPGFSFLITGDMEHAKGQSRFGIGIQMEQ
ncbi:1261_t:CDS:2 [Paraglomus occultum]|uniref:1261_t:CDS:1 n=1 Tax=Paraglomus occultum TaxID=144539 RepID=A0A9N9BHS0_9GLOM|nr:1261_t:CDS:2 [Paraglomus occultum]